jgi:hypothetical protein
MLPCNGTTRIILLNLRFAWKECDVLQTRAHVFALRGWIIYRIHPRTPLDRMIRR